MVLVGDPRTAEALERRLRASADSVEAWLDGYEDEVRVRDGIVLEAIDAGCPQAEVAAWAHLSRARVHQIVVSRLVEAQASSEG